MRKFLALAVPVLVLAFVLAKIGVNQEAAENNNEAVKTEASAENQQNAAANAETAAANTENAAENTQAANDADEQPAADANATANDELAANNTEIPAISEEELIALFENTTNNLVVLDTREKEAFEQARLIGSISTPKGQIAKDALRNVLGEQASVVILCDQAQCDAVQKISETAEQAQIDKNKFRTFTTQTLENLQQKGLTINAEANEEDDASRS